MSIAILDSDAPGIAIAEEIKKTRQERLQEGTLILTENLSTGIWVSLRFKSILGDVEITHEKNSRELLSVGEKQYFRNIPDLETWPTNGIIEVWTPTSNINEYTVVKYRKLK